MNILAVPLLLAPAVAAFGTINTAGQQAEHERVTRTALQCVNGTASDGSCFEPISMTSFAGGDGSFGAVGAPDGSTEVFEPRAHCDDADYMDYAKWGLNGTYPRTKEQRNHVLVDCYSYLKGKWDAGIQAAAELVDENGNLIDNEVKLANNDGKGVSCTFTGGFSNRAKCDVYDGFGRAIHGLQDFYSHSNWVDSTTITPNATTPPGLGNHEIAPFLSMINGTGPTGENIPDDFSTGCFNLFGKDTTDGAAACIKEGRTVTHVVLNKDKGTINVQPHAQIPDANLTTNPTTPRGQIADNFERAVEGAVLETRRQWAEFRVALAAKYGSEKARVMICALTHDYPLRDCYPGRHLAVIVDSSAAAEAGKQVTSNLVSSSNPGDKAADRVAVYDASKNVYALGDPSSASFDGVAQGNSLAASVRLATAAFNGTKNEGIVIISTTSGANVSDLISAIDAAGAKGIRVSHGLITYQPNVARRALRFFARMLRVRDEGSRWVHTDIATAVLRTNGTYAVIGSTDAQPQFAQHVLAWGPTNAESTSPKLYTDVTTVADTERTYQYTLEKNANVNATVVALKGGSASVALTEDDKERSKGSGSTVSLQYNAKKDDTVNVQVTPQDKSLYAVSLSLTAGAAARAAPSVLAAVVAAAILLI